MGVTGNSARRALQKAGVAMVRIHERLWLVTEADLAAFMEVRPKRGRPHKKT